MEIKIMASGSVVLTPELKQTIENKIEKVSMLLKADPAAMIDVEVGTTAGGQRTGDIFRAEINVQLTGGMVRAEAVRSTIHSALDEAVAEARREVRKRREKKRDLMRDGASKIKDFFRRFGR